ncbi:MAG: hypothetical protein ACJAUH_002948 [Saprospiraceae bacterium]|jgi:hypothetical protein
MFYDFLILYIQEWLLYVPQNHQIAAAKDNRYLKYIEP